MQHTGMKNIPWSRNQFLHVHAYGIDLTIKKASRGMFKIVNSTACTRTQPNLVGRKRRGDHRG